MKIYLKQIKTNNKFNENNSGFVDLGLVETCDELVLGTGEKYWSLTFCYLPFDGIFA